MMEELEREKAQEISTWQEIVATLPEGICIFDLDGAIYDCNDAYANLVGYSKAELLQKGWLELTPPEYQAAGQKYLTEVMAGQTVRFEKAYVHRAGHHVPILISYQLLTRRPGWDKDRLVATCIDLTTIKAKERELTRIRAAVDGTEAKIMIADAQGSIVYANASAQKLFGEHADEVKKRLPHFDPERLVGSSYDAYHRDPQATQALIAQLTEPHHTTIAFGARTFAFVANPIFLDGERIGTSVEWRDITEELVVQREVEMVIERLKAGDFSMRLTPKESLVAQRLAVAINALLDEAVALLQYSQRCLDRLAQAHIIPDHEPLAGAARAIQESYNQTVAGLRTLLQAARQAGMALQHASREIQHSQADLTARSSREAASLEEISATAEELSTATAQTAHNANDLSSLAADVHAHTASAQHSVTTVTEVMANAAKSAAETRGIAQTVQQIAFQTNILSLNASIEAARSGEHGRGFAVIATEIRKLSNHVSQEAKEVEQIVELLLRSMHDGTTGIQQVAEEIVGIERLSATMAEHSRAIAQAAKEQDSGLTELSKGVAALDEALTKNAAMAEEIQASSAAMIQHIETLMAEMARFQLEGEEPQGALRRTGF